MEWSRTRRDFSEGTQQAYFPNFYDFVPTLETWANMEKVWNGHRIQNLEGIPQFFFGGGGGGSKSLETVLPVLTDLLGSSLPIFPRFSLSLSHYLAYDFFIAVQFHN